MAELKLKIVKIKRSDYVNLRASAKASGGETWEAFINWLSDKYLIIEGELDEEIRINRQITSHRIKGESVQNNVQRYL